MPPSHVGSAVFSGRECQGIMLHLRRRSTRFVSIGADWFEAAACKKQKRTGTHRAPVPHKLTSLRGLGRERTLVRQRSAAAGRRANRDFATAVLAAGAAGATVAASVSHLLQQTDATAAVILLATALRSRGAAGRLGSRLAAAGGLASAATGTTALATLAETLQQTTTARSRAIITAASGNARATTTAVTGDGLVGATEQRDADQREERRGTQDNNAIHVHCPPTKHVETNKTDLQDGIDQDGTGLITYRRPPADRNHPIRGRLRYDYPVANNRIDIIGNILRQGSIGGSRRF